MIISNLTMILKAISQFGGYKKNTIKAPSISLYELCTEYKCHIYIYTHTQPIGFQKTIHGWGCHSISIKKDKPAQEYYVIIKYVPYLNPIINISENYNVNRK
jgi:hypothetical protein